MAQEIIYSDLDFKLRRISSSGDVNKVTNESAINQALVSLFSTTKGERLFNPNYGSNIKRLLFEPLDTLTAERLADDIKLGIRIWEPRIELTELAITVDHDDSLYKILIEYQILNTLLKGTLNVTLEKV